MTVADDLPVGEAQPEKAPKTIRPIRPATRTFLSLSVDKNLLVSGITMPRKLLQNSGLHAFARMASMGIDGAKMVGEKGNWTNDPGQARP